MQNPQNPAKNGKFVYFFYILGMETKKRLIVEGENVESLKRISEKNKLELYDDIDISNEIVNQLEAISIPETFKVNISLECEGFQE